MILSIEVIWSGSYPRKFIVAASLRINLKQVRLWWMKIILMMKAACQALY